MYIQNPFPNPESTLWGMGLDISACSIEGKIMRRYKEARFQDPFPNPESTLGKVWVEVYQHAVLKVNNNFKTLFQILNPHWVRYGV